MSTTKFEPFWEDKCWGRVQHIFADEHAAVSLLQVVAGWKCSRHSHNNRYNIFAVQEGAIVIEEWYAGQTKTLTLLTPGETLIVPPKVVHRFRIRQSGRLVEVYKPDPGKAVDRLDIVRLDIGGRDEGLDDELRAAGLLK